MPSLNSADDIRLGSTQVDRVYLGSNLVWSNAVAPPGIDAASIIGWWDASALTAGTQPWDDISGAGPTLTAIDAPAVIEDASGGLSAFSYDIADTEYHEFVATASAGQAVTYAVAFRADAVAETTAAFGNGSPMFDRFGWVGFSLHQTGGVTYATAYAYDTAVRASSPVPITLGEWQVATLTVNAGATVVSFAVDGGTPVQITGLTGETERNGLYIGSGYNNYFEGAVGEVVASAETVTGTDLEALTDYLVDKWAPTPPGPLHVWLLGNSAVTGGAFATAGEEDSALALEGRGHTVTRRQSSTITTAPLTTDCDVVIHMDGTVGADEALRGTAANAAPIIAGNTYYYADAYGHVGLATGPTGTSATDDTYEILSLTPGWTDGYAIADTVVVWPFAIYQEAVQGTVAGGEAFIRTPATGHNVCVGFEAGTINLVAAPLTARVVLFNVWADIFRLNASGLQILDDLVAWAIA